MSLKLSAPAIILATSATTLITGFDPAVPGTRTCSRINRCRPARSAKATTGTRPAHETRLGSSKTAETLWQTRMYQDVLLLGTLEPSISPIVPGQQCRDSSESRWGSRRLVVISPLAGVLAGGGVAADTGGASRRTPMLLWYL